MHGKGEHALLQHGLEAGRQRGEDELRGARGDDATGAESRAVDEHDAATATVAQPRAIRAHHHCTPLVSHYVPARCAVPSRVAQHRARPMLGVHEAGAVQMRQVMYADAYLALG